MQHAGGDLRHAGPARGFQQLRLGGCQLLLGGLAVGEVGGEPGMADPRAVRIAPRQDGWNQSPDLQALQAKSRAGELTADEKETLATLRHAWEHQLLAADPDALFTVTEVSAPVPHRARLHASVACEQCGESVMETLVRRLGGRELCIPCFDKEYAAA